MEGFCQKDNVMVELDKGCRHPKDYCQYRQACMVHFHELERRRAGRLVPEPRQEDSRRAKSGE